ASTPTTTLDVTSQVSHDSQLSGSPASASSPATRAGSRCTSSLVSIRTPVSVRWAARGGPAGRRRVGSGRGTHRRDRCLLLSAGRRSPRRARPSLPEYTPVDGPRGLLGKLRR